MEKAFGGKKEQASYFKEDAIQPMEVEGRILGGVDEAAFISEADIDKALEEWKQEVPARFKDLLEADNAE
jgi:hypothetical protein